MKIKFEFDDMPVRNAVILTASSGAALELAIDNIIHREWLFAALGFILAAIALLKIFALLTREREQVKTRLRGEEKVQG